jgi:thermopsin
MMERSTRTVEQTGKSKVFFVALLSSIILATTIVAIIYEIHGNANNKSFDASYLLEDTLYGAYLNNSHIHSPVGIASYGVYNYSGSLRPYNITTEEVIGEANVSSLSPDATVWNHTLSPLEPCNYCASLQLNLNVMVETSNGVQLFWIQNIVPFTNTVEDLTEYAAGQIYNMTTSNANFTANYQGNGILSQLGGQTLFQFGDYPAFGPTLNYSLPLKIKLVTQIEENKSGIVIHLYDEPFGNGTFGTVYFPIANVTSAFIVASAYKLAPLAPSWWNYDAALVWASYCCFQTTKFQKMNSTLSLSYLNSSGQLSPFPALYTFGSDTGESASNLIVTPTPSGAEVGVGDTTNNAFLKN